VVSELRFVNGIVVLDVTISCDAGLLRVEGETREQI